jgi:hypothetical protein
MPALIIVAVVVLLAIGLVVHYNSLVPLTNMRLLRLFG